MPDPWAHAFGNALHGVATSEGAGGELNMINVQQSVSDTTIITYQSASIVNHLNQDAMGVVQNIGGGVSDSGPHHLYTETTDHSTFSDVFHHHL